MDLILQFLWDGLVFLFDHFVFVNIILSIIVVFFQRKEPASTWAWLLILYAVPVVGFIIYVTAGMDFHKRKMFRTKEIEDRLNEVIRKQEQSIKSHELLKKDAHLSAYSDLVLYNLESNGSILTNDNAIQIFTDGNEKFDALIADIERAEKYIFIQIGRAHV